MKKLTLKFGGTSVGTIEQIRKVANIVKKRHDDGNQIIVIVSAMAGATNELMSNSKSIVCKLNMILVIACTCTYKIHLRTRMFFTPYTQCKFSSISC